MAAPKIPMRERFEANVQRTPTCWLWTGTKLRSGYGVLNVYPKRMLKAHRVAWELFRGQIPDDGTYHGTMVLHNCDNPPCVNPDHLRLGTAADNARDRVQRGRGNSAKGSQHGRSKLTEEQIRAIHADVRPHREISSDYSISRTHVGAIKSGRKWRHL